MKNTPCRLTPLLALALSATLGLMGCGNHSSSNTAQGDLQTAVKARTEATELQLEVAKVDKDILDLMRKVVAKADAKQTEGNILLTKDHYGDATEAYKEAARLYRQVADGKKLLDQLAKAEKNAATARMLAEATAKPDQLKDVKRLETNAEGYLQAGDFAQAIAEYEKARTAYAKLLPSTGEATLEQAVAARTAMLAARDQVKNLPQLVSARADNELRSLQRKLGIASAEAGSASKESKPGSLADLVGRARKAESAAADALEERQYTPARALFAAAEKAYHEAALAQGKRDAVAAARQSAEEVMKKADAAFQSSARPASFERGKQALADADKALAEDDLETTKPLLATAAEQFAAAKGEAEQMNALAEAQHSWSAALAAADEDLLGKHAARQFQAAKAKADAAQSAASAGQTGTATAQFKQAAAALAEAVASAKTAENAAKAAPVIARLGAALSGRDTFQAEDILAELENLIPSDPRMAGLRDKVAALPAPKENLTLELGSGVTMQFVLVRPGSFTMGAGQSRFSDEKPAHKVTITKPFYLGKYEVTQEQWEKVMGSNPSNFKGPKLPVEQVNWSDCQSFLTKLQEKSPGHKFALPTEAQWEYACRAGSTGDYCFGDGDAKLDEYAWYSSNAGNQTHPVGGKKPNAWGLYDMHGNVREWCNDGFGYYSSEAVSDPAGASSGNHMLRGGTWLSDPGMVRCAYRYDRTPDSREYTVGLRCVVVSESAR